MKNLIIMPLMIIFLFGVFATLQAQVDTLWTAKYGDPDTAEYVNSAIEVENGSFVFAGYQTDGTTNDFIVSKFDSSGSHLWDKQYGDYKENLQEYGYKIIEDADGNYVVGGYVFSPTKSYQVMLVKIDTDGDTLWTRTYGSANTEYFSSLTQLPNGNYAIVGQYYDSSIGQDSYDGYLLMVNTDGDSLTSETYDLSLDNSYESFQDVTTDENGDIIIVGLFYLWDSGTGDYLWGRIDHNTLNINEKTINGGDFDWATAVYRMSDNGYAITGFSNVKNSSYDFWTVRTNENGDSLWTKVYGSDSYSDYPDGVVETPDGGVLVSGFAYNSGNGYNEPNYVKYTADGKLQGHRNYAFNRYYGYNYWGGNSLVRTSTDNYFQGLSYVGGSSYDMIAIKFDRGDYLGLQALYNALGGDNWNNNTNWMTNELYEDWFGISTFNDRVIGIDLSANSLSGDFPPEFNDLRFLVNIDLSDNDISGEFNQITDHKYAASVDISSNNFGGIIPSAIGDLAGLQTLRAKGNLISGTIPSALGTLSNLTVLDLSDNNISGGIPKSLGDVTTLDTLNLSGNILSGAIPAELEGLTNTRSLDLSGNNLSGEIPVELGNMTNLEELFFQGNQLSGAVPSEVENLANLHRISIADNLLVDLPNLSGMTWLSEFHVENNLFTFEDLEPNVSIDGFSYAPQDSVGEAGQMLVSTGDNIEITVDVSGTSNTYQWFKDDAPGSGATSSTLTISNAQVGDAGVYRCEISNTVATDLTLFSRPQVVEVYPIGYNLTHTLSFPEKGKPGDYEAADYRLIGLPGAGTTPISEVFTGKQGSDWQAFWDNGDPSTEPKDFLVKADGSSIFQFKLGRAFWIISKGSVDLADLTVNTAPLDGDRNASLPLDHAGWNLITNPFDVSVSWADVQAENGMDLPLWSYNGSSASTLQPYTGYYFDNSEELASLKIPYPGAGGAIPKVAPREPTDWEIRVTLESADWADSSMVLGVASSADQHRDPYDLRKPRIVANTPSIYFEHPDWGDGYPVYATDIQSTGQNGYTWEMTVSSPRSEQMSMMFTGISSLTGSEPILLQDKRRNKTVDLRQDSVYTFVSRGDKESFQLLVGAKASKQNQAAQQSPGHFALENNYPNPFNPSGAGKSFTTIPVAIADPTEMLVEIYDLGGQYVRTLFDGPVQPGYEYLQWDGTNTANQPVASGVYLCRMETRSGIHLARKILLVK